MTYLSFQTPVMCHTDDHQCPSYLGDQRIIMSSFQTMVQPVLCLTFLFWSQPLTDNTPHSQGFQGFSQISSEKSLFLSSWLLFLLLDTEGLGAAMTLFVSSQLIMTRHFVMTYRIPFRGVSFFFWIACFCSF